jgi:hypothetical protein
MHTPEKKPEILLTCPVCKQPGFTLKGLGAHRCKAQAREKLSLKNIQQAVRDAHPIQVVKTETDPERIFHCKQCGKPGGVLRWNEDGGPICQECRAISAPPVLSPAIDTIITAIIAERLRQEDLKAQGQLPFTCMDRDADEGIKLAVLVEEVGEVAKEVQERYAFRDEEDGESARRLYTELIQVAAVAAAWAEAIAEDLTED